MVAAVDDLLANHKLTWVVPYAIDPDGGFANPLESADWAFGLLAAVGNEGVQVYDVPASGAPQRIASTGPVTDRSSDRNPTTRVLARFSPEAWRTDGAHSVMTYRLEGVEADGYLADNLELGRLIHEIGVDLIG